ncbi:MAG: PAS domain S-box protein, partial [Oligoflexia bacterium]|nr:PAS domain S-box protein [Oligoflexia bacterium]
MSDPRQPRQALAAIQARVAELEAELSASRRTVDVLMARVQREQSVGCTDRRSFLRAIGQLETTVAARRRDLAEREEYYRALFHQSPDAILAVDEQGIVLSCNRTAELTFGQDLARLVGQSVTKLVSAESGASLMGLLWSGFSGVGGAELIAPHGRLLAFSVARLSPTEVLLVLRDVTERRRLEDALEGARRYAGYGRLAAELAAEITNPLSVVLGRLELLQQRPPTSPRQLLPVLEVLAEHCRRIDSTVGNLRALGKPRPPHHDPLGL